MNTWAFTGHRPGKLGGYSNLVDNRLRSLAHSILLVHQPERIISGMALGWDMAVVEAAIGLNIPFIAALPFKNQSCKWPAHSQFRHAGLLSKAVEIRIVCEGEYSPYAMQKRNEWMVDNCQVLAALWDGSPSGTANCVEYARSINRPVINFWQNWVAQS